MVGGMADSHTPGHLSCLSATEEGHELPDHLCMSGFALKYTLYTNMASP